MQDMRSIRSAVLALLVPAALAAQTNDEPDRLTVSATASVERAPDRAVLMLAVESEAATAREASQQNATNMTRVVDAIRQAGVPADRIRTISLQLNPVYSRPAPGEQGPRITGYRASNMVQITVDSIVRLGAVMDASVAAGANRVTGLHFELRDPASARTEAIEKAVAMARQEAEVAARAAGQRLGAPIEIQIGSSMPPPRPMFAAARMDVELAQAATPVEQGTLEVSATVTMVYRIERE